MCGRFTLRNLDDLKARYGETDFRPSYNFAPGHKILTITDKFQTMEWGFTPYWAEKPFNLINARIETLFEKPSFTNSNRCLIPADGWYEWKQKDEVKVPYFHHLRGDSFFFGGVFGGYRGKVGCAVVTTDAVESLKNIHDCADIFSSKAIKNHPVSTHVNNPLNDDPKCVFPSS